MFKLSFIFMHTVDFVGLSASWHLKSRIVSTDRLVEPKSMVKISTVSKYHKRCLWQVGLTCSTNIMTRLPRHRQFGYHSFYFLYFAFCLYLYSLYPCLSFCLLLYRWKVLFTGWPPCFTCHRFFQPGSHCLYVGVRRKVGFSLPFSCFICLYFYSFIFHLLPSVIAISHFRLCWLGVWSFHYFCQCQCLLIFKCSFEGGEGGQWKGEFN